METNETNPSDQASAFLKTWTESLSKLLQTACTFGPDTIPKDMLHQIRAGIFTALSQTWEEFMRSPQFLESMKQMMEQAIAFRKLSTEFLTKARREMEGTTREDVDSVMLAIRHLEQRVLDRVAEISDQVDALKTRLEGTQRAKPSKPSRPKPAPNPLPRKIKEPRRRSSPGRKK